MQPVPTVPFTRKPQFLLLLPSLQGSIHGVLKAVTGGCPCYATGPDCTFHQKTPNSCYCCYQAYGDHGTLKAITCGCPCYATSPDCTIHQKTPIHAIAAEPTGTYSRRALKAVTGGCPCHATSPDCTIHQKTPIPAIAAEPTGTYSRRTLKAVTGGCPCYAISPDCTIHQKTPIPAIAAEPTGTYSRRAKSRYRRLPVLCHRPRLYHSPENPNSCYCCYQAYRDYGTLKAVICDRPCYATSPNLTFTRKPQFMLLLPVLITTNDNNNFANRRPPE